MKQEPIYVEINITSDLDTLWEYTQNPALHKKWDLRFSNITYLHRKTNEPQKFLYETRIGFGLKVSGTGETVGVINQHSSHRVSSLAFHSDHPLSLIETGRGYWKYIPHDNRNITFITQYQYKTRYGLPGRWMDRFVFRPLLGWATAWSFDALRLWIEQNRHPKTSAYCGFAYVMMCLFFSLYWFHQGFTDLFLEANRIAAAAESGVGILWMVPFRRKWLFHAGQICIFAAEAFLQSGILLSVLLGTLTAAGVILSLKLPSARHTKRKRKK